MLEQQVSNKCCSSIQLLLGEFYQVFWGKNFFKKILFGASKFHFLNYKNFFRADFFYLLYFYLALCITTDFVIRERLQAQQHQNNNRYMLEFDKTNISP